MIDLRLPKAILRAEPAALVRRLRANPLGPAAGLRATARLGQLLSLARLEALVATGLERHTWRATAALIERARERVEACILEAWILGATSIDSETAAEVAHAA